MPKVNLETKKKKKEVSFDHQLNRQTLSGRERAGEEGAKEAARQAATLIPWRAAQGPQPGPR